MLASTFDYHLPQELIAQHPTEARDDSRLMVLYRDSGKREHIVFRDLPDFLKTNDLLVLNDTRVIPARFFGKKHTGARIEITLIEKKKDNLWRCLAKPGRRLKPGITIEVNDQLAFRPVEKLDDASWMIEIITDLDVMSAFEKVGRAPLPPYIRRSDTESHSKDLDRYQTVYARHPGAVAAPTAGLHFTDELIEEIKSRGISTTSITLHVGWGSFAPVREERAEEHRVEPEYFQVGEDAARALSYARQSGGRVVAVGTTSVRTIETAWKDGEVKPMEGTTDLYIMPGHRFKAVDVLLTNFHLPRSSLIMLAAAFAGTDIILDAYREAVEMKYRFYSYGDAMLIV